MIDSIDIRNFKCFRATSVHDCRRVNVIVGDNGVGKTALLEAIFLALGGSPELPVRFRQQRGLGGLFGGAPRDIEDAIFGDLFYNLDQSSPITIALGGSGPEARSLTLARGEPALRIVPIGPLGNEERVSGPELMRPLEPIVFDWRDSNGVHHMFSPKVSANGLEFGDVQAESLPDFFYFSSSVVGISTENAGRFSQLRKVKRTAQFVQTFTREYDWLEDLSIEVVAGAPILHATIKGLDDKLPVTSVSGAINRHISILLGIASRPRSVVLVDEAENGVYFKHHKGAWGALLNFAREFDSQIFTTTHSEEWLEALAEAAGEENEDISLWRMERSNEGPVIRQFSGATFKAGIETGGELR